MSSFSLKTMIVDSSQKKQLFWKCSSACCFKFPQYFSQHLPKLGGETDVIQIDFIEIIQKFTWGANENCCRIWHYIFMEKESWSMSLEQQMLHVNKIFSKTYEFQAPSVQERTSSQSETQVLTVQWKYQSLHSVKQPQTKPDQINMLFFQSNKTYIIILQKHRPAGVYVAQQHMY